MPDPIVPIRVATAEEVLYGDRVTQYRWEVLSHSNGVDHLIGELDGVTRGSLSWVQNAAVKGSGRLNVLDLPVARPGKLRISDLDLASARIRPVCVIDGLPENPLGTFLVSAAREEWEATGRTWSLELLDRTTVPQQDLAEQTFAVDAGTLILPRVKTILADVGEYIDVDASETAATRSGMAWDAGTSKLTIINDLLDVAGYGALWVDGTGALRVSPRVLPAQRSVVYEALGVPRNLIDGAQSIYHPDWTMERDSFAVPNKVIAVQAAGGEDAEALTGTWTNEDPASPYSYISRGRWLTYVLDNVETPEGTTTEIQTFLQDRARATLVAMSAVQAEVKITHLPIPARVGDAVRFGNSGADVDGRYIITRLELDATALGLMKSTLQEVVSL